MYPALFFFRILFLFRSFIHFFVWSFVVHLFFARLFLISILYFFSERKRERHPVIWDEIKPRGLLGVARGCSGLLGVEPRVNPEQPKLRVARGLLEVARGLLGIDRNPSIIY